MTSNRSLATSNVIHIRLSIALVGYKKIQDSFNEQLRVQDKAEKKGGILGIFAKLTTKKRKMTECDKIQLSYFINNQSDKTSSKAFSRLNPSQPRHITALKMARSRAHLH